MPHGATRAPRHPVVDQDAFRQTYREVNEQFCAYEKSILTNQCGCSQAERFCIAEREGVHCKSKAAQGQCLALQKVLREHARFALKATSTPEKRLLPHGKAIRIQVGGLRGLFQVLNPNQPLPPVIPDIQQLVTQAKARYGSLDNLPFPQIMQQITAYQGRPRSRRRQR